MPDKLQEDFGLSTIKLEENRCVFFVKTTSKTWNNIPSAVFYCSGKFYRKVVKRVMSYMMALFWSAWQGRLMYALNAGKGLARKRTYAYKGGGRKVEKPEMSYVSTSMKTPYGIMNPFFFSVFSMILRSIER